LSILFPLFFFPFSFPYLFFFISFFTYIFINFFEFLLWFFIYSVYLFLLTEKNCLWSKHHTNMSKCKCKVHYCSLLIPFFFS
jgi:hypothetical protein